jgi:hypothetical protein
MAATSKVTWGIDEDTIGSAESFDTEPYDGPELPHRGVFNFAVRRAELQTSSNDNPMIRFLLVADDSRAEKKAYKGAPVWTRLVVTDNTAFRVRALCDALGVSYKDFTDRTVVDGEDNIVSIGKVKFNGKTPVHLKAQVGIQQGGQYAGSPDILSWLRKSDTAEEEAPEVEPEETEPAEPDGYDEDARREELEGMAVADLRELAQWLADQQWVIDPKGKPATLVDMIVDIEQSEDFEGYPDEGESEPEPEPEPEPPARATRARKATKTAPAKATAAKKSTTRRRAPF